MDTRQCQSLFGGRGKMEGVIALSLNEKQNPAHITTVILISITFLLLNIEQNLLGQNVRLLESPP
jgi:hypothetical protein